LHAQRKSDFPPLLSTDTNGPNRPFASWLSAAAQLHQTGHSSTLQHFGFPNDNVQD
jgi:hypothetical protein